MNDGTSSSATTEKVEFGIFDWIDENSGLDIGETYEQRLQMLELADQSGFWCYHMAEHHGTPLAIAPSPNLFLAAASQRTQRLRFGPLVQLLPLYNPLRNIEEVCELDHLSGGRLELGVGRGVSPEELAIYGLVEEEARKRFGECLDILLAGLARPEVTYEGEFYSLANAPVSVRPRQQPYPPLWYPTSNPDRVPWVAAHGFNTLFGFNRTGLDHIAAGVQQYRTAYAAHANDSQRLNGHVPEPKLGATRHLYVADTDEAAIEVAREAYTRFDRSFVTRPGRAGGESRRGDFDTALSWGGIFAGSPDSVRRQVQEFVDGSGVNYFVGTFAFGNLTTQQVQRSMELFAQEVMPSVAAGRERAPG